MDKLPQTLLPRHWEQLTEGSGILPEVIAGRGYRSIYGPDAYSQLKVLGFNKVQARLAPGLLIPILGIDGKPAIYQFRPDTPRLNKDGKPIKYETPAKASMRLDFGVGQQELLKNPTIPIYITEGIKKVDALQSQRLCAVGLLGVWNFNGKNPYGGVTFLADWDDIALNGREVRIVFDNDVMLKRQVRQALERLKERLERKGAQVRAIYLPTEGGKKIGIDDYLVSGKTIVDLEGLIEGPRPEIQPAKPRTRLLPEAPQRLRRPLALMNGRAYAATWVWVETTITQQLNKAGEVVTLAEPRISEDHRLLIVRDDGRLFADFDDPSVQPIRDLGLRVHLPEVPEASRLWSVSGVTRYRKGTLVNAAEVFTRVVRVYDHFMDFSRSLDEQPRMCKLSACMSLMTWFADAFTVLPYPWTNSPAPGSGKTKWGHCWTKTSYLGCLTSGTGTFAALRDLAEMGATLLFDDAEALADTKTADPDKQALILAGNRKGLQIPLKEPGADGRWHSRWVNAYCPRGFTAIKLPFRALQTRSIVIPLIASADSQRANRDPENPEDWPIDESKLRDDLWSLALWLQKEASDIWKEMSGETSAIGRNWERWRAVITVARLFERYGIQDLEADMRRVMGAYQDQKDELEGTTRIAWVIRALMRMANIQDTDIRTFTDVSDISPETPPLKISAKEVAKIVNDLLSEEGVDNDEEGKKSWANAWSVGRILSQLRLKQERDSSKKKRDRYREITRKDIVTLAIAHQIIQIPQEGIPEQMSETSGNVQMSGRSDEQKPDVAVDASSREQERGTDGTVADDEREEFTL